MSKSSIRNESYRNPKWIKEMYLEQGYSACAIAKICKRSPSTIYKYMKKLKIPCRSISEANKGKSIKNLQGQKLGRLTVLSDSGKRIRECVIWACLCSCGNLTEVSSVRLKSGHTRSCGCLSRELASKRFTTHGESKAKLYQVWVGIKKRCYNPKLPDYKKGITVCSEWRNDYLAFKTWALANGYEKGLALSRKDKNGNFTPENCRWITRFNVAKAGNLQGKRFGRLTVLRDSGKRKEGGVVWTCLCLCGNFREVLGLQLIKGSTRSCGCLQLKHGESDTRLHNVWKGMKKRCHSSGYRDYKYYGRKGIQVCAEWRNSYITFRNWALNNGYADNLTIDRINNDGNYEPSNCQFLTKSENTRKGSRNLKKERERLFAMIFVTLMRS